MNLDRFWMDFENAGVDFENADVDFDPKNIFFENIDFGVHFAPKIMGIDPETMENDQNEFWMDF